MGILESSLINTQFHYVFPLSNEMKLQHTKKIWKWSHKYDNVYTKEIESNTLMAEYLPFLRYKYEISIYVSFGTPNKISAYDKNLKAKP